MMYLTPYNRRFHMVNSFNPFRELDRLEREFFGESSMNGFLIDIIDKGESYLLEAELPGFKKEDIKIDLDGDTMTISATRSSENRVDKKSYLRSERSYGSYRRSFDVSEIDQEQISAAYNDGVLTVTLPKLKSKQGNQRTLQIN